MEHEPLTIGNPASEEEVDQTSALLLSCQTLDTVSKGGKLLMPAYLKYQRRRPLGMGGWEDGRMQGEATKRLRAN